MKSNRGFDEVMIVNPFNPESDTNQKVRLMRFHAPPAMGYYAEPAESYGYYAQPPESYGYYAEPPNGYGYYAQPPENYGYDSLAVEPEKQLRDVENSNTLKFFVNVQGKTKLETNLQSASLLPHYNTFEARAMRVVISDLPPEFPDKIKVSDEDLPVTDEEGDAIKVDPTTGTVAPPPASGTDTRKEVKADIELGLDRVMELLREARESEEKTAFLPADEDGVTLKATGLSSGVEVDVDSVADAGGSIDLTVADLEGLIADLKDQRQQPPKEQIRPNDGAGTIIGKLVYNTVTTFFVGEKIMISMPTWFFPGGAGPYSETGKFTTHGEPSPAATFRFAEPIYIDKQQNFRVEIEVPDSDSLKEIQKIYGPLTIWVVLDGYMTRDVQ